VTAARRRDTLALSILAFLPVALFFDVLAGLRCLYLRDLSNFHYPAKKILREIVLHGDFPFWNPYFSAGQPMAANPQHEVFYPLTWLILLPNYDLGFHLLIVAHVAIALFTMYALLRSMALGPVVSLLGAISYGLGGLALSTLNLLPFLFSMAWMPLSVLFARRALPERRSQIADRGSQAPPTTDNRQPTTTSQPWWRGGLLRSAIRDPRSASLAALVLAIQLLIGEPATALQTGILIGAYALWKNRVRGLAAVAAISAGALLLAAVQVLPAVDHLRDSVRANKLDIRRVASWSMPLARIGEIVNPDLLGDPVAERPGAWNGASLYPGHVVPFYFSLYIGLLLTAAPLAGIVTRARGAGLALAIIALSILLAAGDHTPLLRILYNLGIGGYLRYPEKFYLMAAFTLIVFGARTLQSLLDGDERLRKTTLALTLLALLVPGANWPLALARIGALTLLLLFLRRLPRPLVPVLLGAFLLLDLAPLYARLTPRMPADYYRRPPLIERQFPRDRTAFRIFHFGVWNIPPDAQRYFEPGPARYWAFRNALVPMTPASHDLRMVLNTDYDATALLPTDDFGRAVWALTQRRPRGWVDTIAAMSNIRYALIFRRFDWASADAKANPRNLQPLRLIEGKPYPRYYFATQVIPIHDRQDFIDKLAGGHYPKQAAFVSESAITGSPFPASPGIVRRWSERTNLARIDVDAAGPAYLVISVTPHKYWRLTIDGKPATAIITNLGYQGLPVPPGRHRIEMHYRNPLIAIGAAISALALLALLAFGVRRR
jgi:hypothetical protein